MSTQQSVKVPVPCAIAFDVFVDGFSHWWPREYSWAADTLETIQIEPRVDGRCFERGPNGFECDWGRVLVWEPPHRLVLTWQITQHRQPQPNPQKSSELEVTFESEDETSTLVHLEHRGFERHGEGAEQYMNAMASASGWAYILSRYAAAAGQPG